MNVPELAYASVFPGSSVQSFAELAGKSRQAAIITHYDADGDAIGSSLALYHYLKYKGVKAARVFTPNPYPAFLHWLPGHDDLQLYEDSQMQVREFIAGADLVCYVDFNTLRRLKSMQELFPAKNAKSILIDHHPGPDIICDLSFSDTKPSSTAELLFYLICAAGDARLVDLKIASNLFTGIMTDTGCFSFNSSQPATWQAVAYLLSLPVDKDGIFSRIYENYTENRMRLMGYCLNEKMKIVPEYKTAYISLKQEELEQFGFLPGDSEGFVNLPFSIGGIRITALFMERKDHIKISFRSKGNIGINRIAREHFSGGGHQNAAGGESLLGMEETISKFISLLTMYEKEL